MVSPFQPRGDLSKRSATGIRTPHSPFRIIKNGLRACVCAALYTRASLVNGGVRNKRPYCPNRDQPYQRRQIPLVPALMVGPADVVAKAVVLFVTSFVDALQQFASLRVHACCSFFLPGWDGNLADDQAARLSLVDSARAEGRIPGYPVAMVISRTRLICVQLNSELNDGFRVSIMNSLKTVKLQRLLFKFPPAAGRALTKVRWCWPRVAA